MKISIAQKIKNIFLDTYTSLNGPSTPYNEEDNNKEIETQLKKSEEDNFNYGIRVYAEKDLIPYYAQGGFSLWHDIEIDGFEKLDKIYHHLLSAKTVRAYVSQYGVICSYYTEKFGWVKCRMDYWLQFEVYKTGNRYEYKPYGNKGIEKEHPELWKYIGKMCNRWSKEWQNDYNL